MIVDHLRQRLKAARSENRLERVRVLRVGLLACASRGTLLAHNRPGDHDGGGGGVHKDLKADQTAEASFFNDDVATAFRIHEGSSPLPSESKNTWHSDEEETMPGVSGYANMSNAVDDMLFGQDESVTGDNYSKQVDNPVIVVMQGQYIDGPGAEVIVPSPKIAAVITQKHVEESFRKVVATWDEHDAALPIDEILETYELTGVDREQIYSQILSDAKERAAKDNPDIKRGQV